MALDFLAGCVGGCAGVIVGHPLDTVKVHLQTCQNQKSNGTFHCLRTIVARDGVRGLYRGMTSPLMGVAGINAIIFGVYGNTQRNHPDPNSLNSHFFAGITAGFTQSFLCSPMELAKSRLQVGGGGGGPLNCLRRIHASDGYRGIFKGLGITIAREIPAFGSYFLTYEYLSRTSNGAPISTIAMITAGGLAGIVSWIIVYPVDVIKSRLQIDGHDGLKQYKNSLDCLKKGLKSEGYNFLYRGLTPTILRAFPVNGATFAVVTWTMRLLGDNENILINSNETGGNEIFFWERYSSTDVVYTFNVSEMTALV